MLPGNGETRKNLFKTGTWKRQSKWKCGVASARTFCAPQDGPRNTGISQETKILASVIEIQKENWGKPGIFQR